MTSSRKKVQRCTEQAYRVVYASKPRPIVVCIDAELLRFREKGRRTWYDLPVDTAFRIAVKRKGGYS
jgi:hypothetical protein